MSYFRKLRKLRRDPLRFTYDLLGKRLYSSADTHTRGIASDPDTRIPHQPVEGFGVPRTKSNQVNPDFNLELFTALNEEYRAKKTVPSPLQYDDKSLRERGRHRVERLNRIVPLAGARVLEIGCGQGEVSRSIAQQYPTCEVLGINILARERWSAVAEPNAKVMVHDVSCDDNRKLGQFDFIVAITVWEHVQHPYSALKAVKSLLKPGGKAYLTINLHRGTEASHLYRNVFFPGPHLLFDDQVFREYYESVGLAPTAPAWVNKLTSEQYTTYFREIGLETRSLSHRMSLIDEDFYSRFEGQLSKYPRRDLVPAA